MNEFLLRVMMFFASLSCLSASLATLSACSSEKEDLYQELVGENFVSVVELFVIKINGAVWVQAPGSASWVPVSVDLYKSRPNDWWEAPESKKRGPDTIAPSVQILGILPVGTTLTVSRVTHFTAVGREIPSVFGYTDDPRFGSEELDFFGLISFRQGIPRPERKYIVPYEEVR